LVHKTSFKLSSKSGWGKLNIYWLKSGSQTEFQTQFQKRLGKTHFKLQVVKKCFTNRVSNSVPKAVWENSVYTASGKKVAHKPSFKLSFELSASGKMWFTNRVSS
jgi:hypothetical protein